MALVKNADVRRRLHLVLALIQLSSCGLCYVLNDRVRIGLVMGPFLALPLNHKSRSFVILEPALDLLRRHLIRNPIINQPRLSAHHISPRGCLVSFGVTLPVCFCCVLSHHLRLVVVREPYQGMSFSTRGHILGCHALWPRVFLHKYAVVVLFLKDLDVILHQLYLLH